MPNKVFNTFPPHIKNYWSCVVVNRVLIGDNHIDEVVDALDLAISLPLCNTLVGMQVLSEVLGQHCSRLGLETVHHRSHSEHLCFWPYMHS